MNSGGGDTVLFTSHSSAASYPPIGASCCGSGASATGKVSFKGFGGRKPQLTEDRVRAPRSPISLLASAQMRIITVQSLRP